MWAYSAMEQGDFLAAVGHGMTANHLRRTAAAAPSQDMLIAAADLVGWSREFALRGPAAIEEGEATLAGRLERVEVDLAQMQDLYSSLVRALKSASSEDAVTPFEDLLRASVEAAQAHAQGRGEGAAGAGVRGRRGRAAAGDDA